MFKHFTLSNFNVKKTHEKENNTSIHYNLFKHV